jgi:hypothetical protein
MKLNKHIQFFRPFIIFVCDVDEIPNKQLYINIKDDHNLLHEGAHIEKLYYFITVLSEKKTIIYGGILLLELIEDVIIYLLIM